MFEPMRKLMGRCGRSLRGAIEAERSELLRQGFGGMTRVLSRWIDPKLMAPEHTGSFSRVRLFDFATTVQGFLWQVLQGQAPCREVVQQVQAMRGTQNAKIPDSGTAAYCRARAKFPMKRLNQINDALLEKLSGWVRPQELWWGREVKLLDGTSVSMEDTPANAQVYAYATGQKPGCGFPLIYMAGMFSLSSGAWLGYATSPKHRHDLALSVDLVRKHVRPGDVVVADRAYCAYWMLALIQVLGGDALVRLHQARITGLGPGQKDKVITWEKPPRPGGCPLSAEEYAALPGEITVRIVRRKLEAKGQRTREVILATTLCEKAIRAKDLGELYLRRWQVELHFDDLKTTLGMDHLKSKSPAMVDRALAVYHCAHNLVRALMLEAAVRAEVPLRRLSFKGSSGALLKAINGPQGPERKTPGRWEIVLEMAADDLLPVRPNRREPRATKRRPKNYQRLTGPRSSFQEVQHRHRAKKPLN